MTRTITPRSHDHGTPYVAESQLFFFAYHLIRVHLHLSLVYGLLLRSVAEYHLPAVVVNVLALLSQSGLDGSFPIMGICHVRETDMVHSFGVKSVTRNGNDVGTCHVRETDMVHSFGVKSVTRNGNDVGTCHVRETDMVHSFGVKSDPDTTSWCYSEWALVWAFRNLSRWRN
jgi:hypothetical protein